MSGPRTCGSGWRARAFGSPGRGAPGPAAPGGGRAGTRGPPAIGPAGAAGEPLEEPVAVGLVRLDGADAVLFHRLIGDGFEIGMRVEAGLGAAPTGPIRARQR